MKEKLTKSKEKLKNFQSEFNKAVSTAITAAFGFLIALTWRDVITEFVDKVSATSPVQGRLFSAIIVTIISVLGIILVAKLFSSKENDSKA